MALAPKFSVIIPTYNRATLTAQAIESVRAQTFTDWEIVVMDDGSRDNTAEVVRKYEAEHSGRIRYFFQENQGKSVALNHAFTKVRGEFVAYLDSDDSWTPEKLEWQFRALEKFGAECPCFTDANYVNNPSLPMTAFEFAGRKYDGDMGLVADPASLFFETRSGIYVQTLALHRDLVRRTGDFDPKLPIGEDTDYLFRLGLTTKFCYVNKPLVKIDRTVERKDGLVELLVRDEPLRLEKREYIYHKWLALTGNTTNGMRPLLLARLAEIYNERANWYLVQKDYSKAREAMSKSVATSFSAKGAVKLALTAVAPGYARRQSMKNDEERDRRRVLA